MLSKLLTIPAAALASAAVLTACGGTPPPHLSARAQAIAYMRSHPVAPRPGMTTAVVLSSDSVGFLKAAARQAHCPATLMVAIKGSVGNLPGCGAWSATVETAAGTVAHLACGSIAARRLCPTDLLANGYIPSDGDYLRFRTDGRITGPAEVQVIREFAVDILGPDPDSGPWITTRAAPTPLKLALSYMRRHPVPHRHGMTAGVVVSDYASGTIWSVTWTLTIALPSGPPVTVPCVNGQVKRTCPWLAGPDVLGGAASPNPVGVYLYFRSDGVIAKHGDTHVIGRGW
jgi:hypothetical protein